MDNRKILQPQTLLSFPGMACTVESLAGAGSNAIVYYGSYPDGHLRGRRHHVLIKELFPCQEQGLIYRDDKNHICWEADAEEEMALQRLSFQRGNEIHLKLLEEHPGEIDANINTFSMHHTLYTVLGFTGGRSMDKELDAPGAVSLRVHIRRMLGALHVLEAFHESGFLHLDVSPDNILLIGNGENERRPKLLILLDGLNEVSGDISVLLQEILELSQMEGVRIFLTSRSRTAELNFTNICLKQLEEDETAQVLAQNGLVPPENPGMRELLRIPMMLSIFVKTAQKEEKQLIIDTRDELLQRYFTAMLDKELHDLPEDSPKRWRTEASFYYVLPQIAALLHRKRSAGSDRVLLPEVR